MALDANTIMATTTIPGTYPSPIPCNGDVYYDIDALQTPLALYSSAPPVGTWISSSGAVSSVEILFNS